MRIIGVAAGKGGVGKTTITVGLARALIELGARVGILDADIYGPSVPLMLRQDRFIAERDGKIVPALCEGIEVVSMSHFGQGAAIVRAPIANGVITQFLNDVLWSELDYLLIDFPPGTGDVQLTLMQEGNLCGAIVVTTPQAVVLRDVEKAMALFHRMNVPILGVVENMSGFFGSGGGKKLSEEWEVPLLAKIPLEAEVAQKCDQAVPFHGEAFEVIARYVAQKSVVSIKEGSLEGIDAEVLQKACPCAACKEGAVVRPGVKVVSAEMVGRYGMKVRFDSGCSNGIYGIELLESLKCSG
ncbi:MAG: P-loop NTPase [Simkaniaceae bacterium]|nr:P-loop NTPase [Simkaniaceae bacterium]